MSELPEHHAMNVMDEYAADVPLEEHADFWRLLAGHAEQMLEEIEGTGSNGEFMFMGAASVTWITDAEGNIKTVSFQTLDDPEVMDDDPAPFYDSTDEVLVKMIPRMEGYLAFIAEALVAGIEVYLG